MNEFPVMEQFFDSSGGKVTTLESRLFLFDLQVVMWVVFGAM